MGMFIATCVGLAVLFVIWVSFDLRRFSCGRLEGCPSAYIHDIVFGRVVFFLPSVVSTEG